MVLTGHLFFLKTDEFLGFVSKWLRCVMSHDTHHIRWVTGATLGRFELFDWLWLSAFIAASHMNLHGNAVIFTRNPSNEYMCSYIRSPDRWNNFLCVCQLPFHCVELWTLAVYVLQAVCFVGRELPCGLSLIYVALVFVRTWSMTSCLVRVTLTQTNTIVTAKRLSDLMSHDCHALSPCRLHSFKLAAKAELYSDAPDPGCYCSSTPLSW